MKKTFIAVAVMVYASVALATLSERSCEPRTKPEPPTVSKPEPRGQQSRSDTVDRPCDRAEQVRPLWCRVLK